MTAFFFSLLFREQGCGRSSGRAGSSWQQPMLPGPGGVEQSNLCACPWESIVEEGFQATLAGSENGKAYGAGIYFARDSVYSDRYAQKAAMQASACPSSGSGQHPGAQDLCRVFLSRIITGCYTTGSPGMSQPPLDPAGAKGEHFHSLVDNIHNPGEHARVYERGGEGGGGVL